MEVPCHVITGTIRYGEDGTQQTTTFRCTIMLWCGEVQISLVIQEPQKATTWEYGVSDNQLPSDDTLRQPIVQTINEMMRIPQLQIEFA